MNYNPYDNLAQLGEASDNRADVVGNRTTLSHGSRIGLAGATARSGPDCSSNAAYWVYPCQLMPIIPAVPSLHGDAAKVAMTAVASGPSTLWSKYGAVIASSTDFNDNGPQQEQVRVTDVTPGDHYILIVGRVSVPETAHIAIAGEWVGTTPA